jgi:hypothetical protein
MMQQISIHPGDQLQLGITVTIYVKYGDNTDRECEIEREAIQSLRSRLAEVFDGINHVGLENYHLSMKELD